MRPRSSKRKSLLCATLFVSFAAVPFVGAQQSAPGPIAKDRLRPFTVADSIAMTHFEVPGEDAFEDAPISPDGKKFFVITERGILDKNLREYSLSVYNLANANKILFTATFDTSSNRPGISQAAWLDERSISFLAEVPNGLPQVYLIDVNTREQRQLTSEEFGIYTYALSKNEQKLLYYGRKEVFTSDTEYKEQHGFAVTEEDLNGLVSGHWRQPLKLSNLRIEDLRSNSIRVLPAQLISLPQTQIWLSPDGRYAIIQQLPNTIPQEWVTYQDPFVNRYVRDWFSKGLRPDDLFETALVDTETGKVRTLIGAPSSVGCVSSAVWSNDNHSVVVAATLLPLDVVDKTELAKRQAHTFVAAVDTNTGTIDKLMEIQKNQWIIVRPGSLPDTLRIIELKEEDNDLGGRVPVLNFHFEDGKWLEDLKKDPNNPLPKITTRQSLDHWPVLVKVNPGTKVETVIFDPNPQLKTFRFGQPEVVNWTDKLGQSLIGGLVYPTGYKAGIRYPLVIQTHGFSPDRFLLDGAFTTAMAAQELANHGVAVLQLPQSPLELASDCKRGEPTQSQIESAVDYLDSTGLIDRGRVGLVGFSITGFNVINALANSTYHFAAATSAEGNDWGYWTYVVGGNWGAWMSQSECPYGGSPWGNNQERWMRDSISFHYDKIHTPLRLESESNDEGWPAVLYEWENYVALKRLHKPVELIYIPHGAHMEVKPWDRMTSQQGEVDWMLFWLKGEEDADPAKAEQYARWRNLQKLQEAEGKSLSSAHSVN